MEYIWFIDPDFNDSKEKIGDICISYLFSKNKPKKISASITTNNLIRFAEKGYGIWKTCSVTTSNLITIENIKNFNEARKKVDPYLLSEYCREKFKAAKSRFELNKNMYCFIVEHEIINLNENAIKIKKGTQGALHIIDNKNIKVLDDKPMSLLYKSDIDDCGFIPGKLRNECRVLYSQIKHFSEFALSGHIDHIVPNSLLGPGCILENLMPLNAKDNLAKSNIIDKGFFDVALRWKLNSIITEDFLNEFDTKKRIRYHEIVQDITKKIWNKPIQLRRKFYWEVRSEIYPHIDFKTAYKKAGIQVDFLDS